MRQKNDNMKKKQQKKTKRKNRDVKKRADGDRGAE